VEHRSPESDNSAGDARRRYNFKRGVRKAAIALVVTAGFGALAWGLVHRSSASEASMRWPGAPARPVAVTFPADFGVRRVYLDAGHGAEDNRGNRSSFCRDEQDFTLALAEDAALRLSATGRFETRVSRSAGELKGYPERVREAEAWGADVFVSLHSDVRGDAVAWEPSPGVSCLMSRAAPGFAVLLSDEGARELIERRLRLARALTGELERAGIVAYDGGEYHEHYAADSRAGVFIDRRDRRIFVLREPSMPSILVETHNALDDREALRWEEPTTREAFASALASALVSLLEG
jgi:N-acetylmuramoyl-L-alanine amidase